VPNGRTFQRQLFLAESIVERHRIPRHGDGGATPVAATETAPVTAAGQKLNQALQCHGRPRTLSVREAARADADRRAARERGAPRPSFLDDPE
jgi:hypothetical protein